MRNSLSPLRYPGGKTCLVPFLSKVLELNDLAESEFVEPYAGSAAAAVHLLLGEYVDSIRINDRDPHIYAFWYSLLHHTDKFCDLILKEPVTIDNWRKQREIYSSYKRYGKLKVAFSTLFLNRCNRSGIITSGGPIGGYAQAGKWKIDVRFNRTELANRIRAISEFSDRIAISNKDGLDFLCSVQRTKRKKLVFLDPPYVEKADRLYDSDFNEKKHEKLAAHLLGTATYPWVLTYDNAKLIRKLYRSRSPRKIVLNYAAQNKRQGTELLVRSRSLRSNFEYLPGGDKCF
ncbi:DNA adenine methylase [Rhodopirellula sp. MGV]|uniref:DNA adenine methylase n=1 Tax=Rhodopirellula sp. MGV TaxID=2023130 RepID=UPI000B975392|nr:DNA adenine methylase [Rhodopirellula sp. MGV]OYP28452.1 hypothetical protein CGZ80_27005 [Rhodopirellula sp. MGV]PNY38670.1 DNA methyltransferase [Rhodopirellula baltica]